MATALTIITRALRQIKVIASGETPNAPELNDGLEAVNRLIETWQTDENAYFSENDEFFAVTPGTGQYAIGNSTVQITGITRVGAIATATTETRHSFENGNRVTVAGAIQPEYNITAAVTVLSPFSFSYVVAGAPATPATTAGDFTVINADFFTDRPVELLGAFMRITGQDYQIGVVTERFWNNIQYKTALADQPTKVLYRPGYPFGQILLNPIPNVAGTLHIKTRNTLHAYGSLSEDQPMPPGYERALTLALAIDMAPEYAEKISPEALASTTNAFTALWGLNTKIPKPSLDNTRGIAATQAPATGG